MPVVPPTTLADLDLDHAIYNWRTSTAGDANIRVGANAKPVEQLAHAVNHLVAKLPRIVFVQGNQIYHDADEFSSRYEVDGDQNGDAWNPYYAFRYPDNVYNGKTQLWRIAGPPKTSTTAATNAFAECYRDGSGGGYEPSPIMDVNVVNTTGPSEFFYHTVELSRVSATAHADGWLYTYNGYPVADLCVQEKPIDVLEDDTPHDYATTTLAKDGEPILADMMEQIRLTFDRHRRNALPSDVCWSGALAARATEGTLPAPTPIQAFILEGPDYTGWNSIFDPTITARNASTPGMTCYAEYAGIGDETDAYTKPIITARVFCEAGDDANLAIGGLKIVGPDHVADNWQYVNFGTALNTIEVAPLRLNARSNIEDDTTAANKIDVFAFLHRSDCNLVITGMTFQRVLST